MKPFYVTTPIYYVNDRPHIGHAYTTLAADVLRRYHALRGRPTRMLTGTDEHGSKLARAAAAEGLEPRAFVDRVAPAFRRMCEQLDCGIDDFIRTTEPRHEERVQALWRRLERDGDLYLGRYSGPYCVACESYYTDKELVEEGRERLCPVHRRPVETLEQESWFFRLSRYEGPLLALYDRSPPFVQPEGRLNEVRAFVREGLRDLSVSRTTERWGIAVPDHPEHTIYVWLDALTNYASALGGPIAAPGEAPLFERFWTPSGEVVHLVGKDILRFHAVYWPAFLMAAGVEPPTTIWAHGWLTVDGQKMSKSAGNFIPPGPLCDAFGGPDVLRYHLMREVAFGQDGDFSHASLVARYQGELANGLGNLLQRVVATLVPRHLGGRIPARPGEPVDPADRELQATATRAASEAARAFDETAPHRALDAVWSLVGAANRYVDLTAPWTLARAGRDDRLREVLYHALEALRWIGLMLWPVMPRKATALRAALGLPPPWPTPGVDRWPAAWGGLASGSSTRPVEPLFPRLDPAAERALLERFGVQVASSGPQSEPERAPSAAPPQTPSAVQDTGTRSGTTPTASATGTTPDGPTLVSIDEFARVDLRVALVLAAERVPRSDRLVRLEVDAGDGRPRQILAGIASHYPDPSVLVGRRLAIVANLPPRKMMGLESQGMVLAAGDGERLALLSPDRDVAPGTRIR
ncbi:MAG: methionine--tRNA ligase [Myxococcota bacterium]|nr:methionine--tRNA ligase [Myxococcota bacterium]MDW8360834.1 methionine--tRNA ligase [Myxococcales bacterium]